MSKKQKPLTQEQARNILAQTILICRNSGLDIKIASMETEKMVVIFLENSKLESGKICAA